jgi:hypothetical protein
VFPQHLFSSENAIDTVSYCFFCKMWFPPNIHQRLVFPNPHRSHTTELTTPAVVPLFAEHLHTAFWIRLTTPGGSELEFHANSMWT